MPANPSTVQPVCRVRRHASCLYAPRDACRVVQPPPRNRRRAIDRNAAFSYEAARSEDMPISRNQPDVRHGETSSNKRSYFRATDEEAAHYQRQKSTASRKPSPSRREEEKSYRRAHRSPSHKPAEAQSTMFSFFSPSRAAPACFYARDMPLRVAACGDNEGSRVPYSARDRRARWAEAYAPYHAARQIPPGAPSLPIQKSSLPRRPFAHTSFSKIAGSVVSKKEAT